MIRIESTCTLGERCIPHNSFKDFEDILDEVESGKVRLGSCDEKTRLTKMVNGGAFGVIFLGEYEPTEEKVAVKMERQSTGFEKILGEGNVLRHLEGLPGVPKVYTFGMHGLKYNFLVEELLGPSFAYLQERQGGKFSLKTGLLLIDQVVEIMHQVHKKGYVHKDISPSNFVMGRDEKKTKVYIIDFGMSKKIEKRSSFRLEGHRRSFAVPHSLDGTPRYASCGAHQGEGENFKDDLEALGYMWVYLLKGSLPWQGLTAETHLEKLGKIFEMKARMSGREICGGLPEEFALYIDYCRSLKSSEWPNYGAIKKMFRDVAERENIQYDSVYDWTKVAPSPGLLSPNIFLRCESATTPRSIVTHKKLHQSVMSQKKAFFKQAEEIDED